MPKPAASVLTEFSVAKPKPFAEPQPQPTAAENGDDTADVAASAAEREEAAFERGRAEGRAAAEEELRAKLEEERAAAAQHLAQERASWAEQESAALAEKITTAFETLQKDVTDIVGAILEPFVEEALRTKSVDELAQALTPLLATGKHALFRVTGPQDLLDALKAKLGASAGSFTFEVTDAVDLSVAVDRTVIETQLGDWLPQIAKSKVA
jgi:hypothetical protein